MAIGNLYIYPPWLIKNILMEFKYKQIAPNIFILKANRKGNFRDIQSGKWLRNIGKNAKYVILFGGIIGAKSKCTTKIWNCRRSGVRAVFADF